VLFSDTTLHPFFKLPRIINKINIQIYFFIPTNIAQYIYLSLYIYIQGDSGGICTTLGDDSMSDSKQKSSYEHGSDF
jgi:hypothetical protein